MFLYMFILHLVMVASEPISSKKVKFPIGSLVRRRFNMTDNYEDLYKFRTPPLYNVAKTAPYSHSGSYYDLKEVIRGHYDPLKNYDSSKFSDSERVEFFKRIKHSSIAPEKVVHLDEEELEDLVNFLNLLSF